MGNCNKSLIKFTGSKFEYIFDDGLDRTVDSAIVVSVRQGKEPAVFKKLFPDWDDDMWENQISYEDIKNETKAANSK